MLRDGDRVSGVRFRHQGTEHEARCDLVVFADGRTSRNADRVGAVPYRMIPSPWTGLLSYYRDLPLPDDRIRYCRQAGSMVIVTPCGPSLWCVAAGLHQALIGQHGEHPARTYVRAAHDDPVIGPALAAGRRVTPVGGAGRLRMHRRPMAGPGWCLVGDAGYHLDPMSALGARAVLTTVAMLRDRIAGIGEVTASPDAYRGLTEQRDALLAAEWDFTERILHSYAPSAAGIERGPLASRESRRGRCRTAGADGARPGEAGSSAGGACPVEQELGRNCRTVKAAVLVLAGAHPPAERAGGRGRVGQLPASRRGGRVAAGADLGRRRRYPGRSRRAASVRQGRAGRSR